MEFRTNIYLDQLNLQHIRSISCTSQSYQSYLSGTPGIKNEYLIINTCGIVVSNSVEVNTAIDTILKHLEVRSNDSNVVIPPSVEVNSATDTSLEHMNVRSNIKSTITSAYYVVLPSIEIISASETSLEYLTFSIIMPHVYFQQTD